MMENTTDTSQGYALVLENVARQIRGSFTSAPPIEEPSPTASEVAAIQSAMEDVAIWDAEKPSEASAEVSPASRAVSARLAAAWARRTRAVWPRTEVSTTTASGPARDFVVADLVDRILGLLPLESAEDARLFARRLEAFAALVGRDALYATRDGDDRTILWHCVDAEDARATRAVCRVFSKSLTKVVAEAPDASNPLAEAKRRDAEQPETSETESLAEVISEALYEYAESDETPKKVTKRRSYVAADFNRPVVPPSPRSVAQDSEAAAAAAAAKRKRPLSFWACFCEGGTEEKKADN